MEQIKEVKPITSNELKDLAVAGLQEKKGKDIVVIDLKHIKNAFADYFVIASGTSSTQVDGLSDSVEEVIFKGCKEHPWHREGKENSEWVLLDYINVVVHIFQDEKRQYFDLENMWGDGIVTHISSEI